MKHIYTNQPVIPWAGMKEMKELLERTGISKKLMELNLPESKSNNHISSIDILESF